MLAIPDNRSLWAPSGFLDIRILYELAGNDNLGFPAHTVPLLPNMTRIVGAIVLRSRNLVKKI